MLAAPPPGRRPCVSDTPANRRIAALLAAVCLVAVAPKTASARSCLDASAESSTIEGRLALQEGLGPAAFLVIPLERVCLTGPDAADKVDDAMSVQLYATTADGFQNLYRLVGERVTVRGKASGKRSFQQRAPIVMEVTHIEVD